MCLSKPIRRNEKTRPLSPIFDQPRSLRITQNIIRLLALRLFAPQAMIEEVSLPANTERSCGEFFEIRDFAFHRTFRQRKPNQPVHMVRHDHEDSAPPDTVFMAMSDRLEQRRSATVTQ